MSNSDANAMTRELLAQAGLEIDDVAIATLLRHLDCLIVANNRLNLTRITGKLDAVRLHLVDSLLAMDEVAAAPQGTLCDIGTGGGYPGIPLAVATRREAVLLDSVTKKAAAVDSIIADCRLGEQVRVAAERAEEYALHAPAAFAVVVARAVAPLPALLELASPLLMDGGLFVALKGRPQDNEVAAGAIVAEIAGFDAPSIRVVSIPGGDETRTILSYRKMRVSSVKLPRRAGMAQRRPLA